MLTATYALVALTVEQTSVRRSLLAFQQYAHANFTRQPWISLGQLQYACDTLWRLHQTGYWRKMESYLFPALRQATRKADALLEELIQLHQSARDLVAGLQAHHGKLAGPAGMVAPAAQFCDGIDAFCEVVLQRLDKEESELFALARGVIGGDAWFAIAHQLLAQDAQLRERRGGRPALLGAALAGMGPSGATPPAPARLEAARLDLPARQAIIAPPLRRRDEPRGALID